MLSFGYWCTNFLVVQRAMAARNMSAARRTPLIAAVPKMLFPALVILPGMIAAALRYDRQGRLPPAAQAARPRRCTPRPFRPSRRPPPSTSTGAAAAQGGQSDAAGVKMIPDKVDALVKAGADALDKIRLKDRSAERRGGK